MKKNKFCYGWNLWTNYGYGWENEGGFYDKKEYSYNDVRRDAKEYRLAGAQIKITSTRILNVW